MSFDDSHLAIRRNKRRVIGVEGRLFVDADHSESVKLTASAPRSSDGSIPITAVDLSEGGIGLLTACFLPRRTKCELILDNPRDESNPIFKADMRVAQARMVDRRPGYQLGLIFEETSADFQRKLRDLIELTCDV